MKSQLFNINQKLSLITENQIQKKINAITELEQQIEQTNNKILEYIQILKKNKNLIISGRTLTMNDINDLVNQYNSHNKIYNKKLISLSTAFGKIQMTIDNIQSNQSNQSNNYSFKL